MHSPAHDSAFRRLEAEGETLRFTFEGTPVEARPGETVAAALLAAGISAFRTNPVTSAPRAPHCMMGVCFECLVEIEGMGARQACLTPAVEGMRVSRLAGPRDVMGKVA